MIYVLMREGCGYDDQDEMLFASYSEDVVKAELIKREARDQFLRSISQEFYDQMAEINKKIPIEAAKANVPSTISQWRNGFQFKDIHDNDTMDTVFLRHQEIDKFKEIYMTKHSLSENEMFFIQLRIIVNNRNYYIVDVDSD